jgi:hypothetical protein
MSAAARLFHWLPRTLCILAILFFSMFVLDASAPGLTPSQQLEALRIHLIPSFVLLALLLIAWKWEFVGGIALAATGLVLSIPVFALNYRRTHSIGVSLSIILMVTIPFVVVGILFIVSHRMRKNCPAAAPTSVGCVAHFGAACYRRSMAVLRWLFSPNRRILVICGAVVVIAAKCYLWRQQCHDDTEAFRIATDEAGKAQQPEAKVQALVKYVEARPRGRYRRDVMKRVDAVLCEKTITDYEVAVAVRDAVSRAAKAVPKNQLSIAAQLALEDLEEYVIRAEERRRQLEEMKRITEKYRQSYEAAYQADARAAVQAMLDIAHQIDTGISLTDPGSSIRTAAPVVAKFTSRYASKKGDPFYDNMTGVWNALLETGKYSQSAAECAALGDSYGEALADGPLEDSFQEFKRKLGLAVEALTGSAH